MTDPIVILQIKNAFISFLNLAAVGVFVAILINDRYNYREVYWKACALVALYFTGEATEQMWYWAWRHFARGDAQWLFSWLPLVIGFNVLIAVACIGIIRMFTVARHGSRMWIAVTGGAFLLACASFLIPRG